MRSAPILAGLFLLCSSFISLPSDAHEEEGVPGYFYALPSDPAAASELQNTPSRGKIADGERLRKFNLALDALQIPHEKSPIFSEFPTENQIAFSNVESRLSAMDPEGALKRYVNITPTRISLYQDFFSALLPLDLLDFSLGLKSSGNSEDSEALLKRLQTIGTQVKDPSITKPLSGLKIVIDPGHMGTPEWDLKGGKFVEVKGTRVSEGQINLWTSLLIANELESLGATVVLTRTVDGTVSKADLQSFDATPYINQFFYNSLDSWMPNYLNVPDSELASTLKNAPEVKKIFSTNQKTDLYIGGEDLEARSLLIDLEKPDVVLDVHFDANKTDQTQNTTNAIEAFVPGAFRNNETGSRTIRSYALKHLIETRRWDESVNLASEITSEMSKNLKLPLDASVNYMSAVKVKDGVYARNLYINRRNLTSLMVYLECLHYDHVDEFAALAKNDQVGNFHGMTFKYPARLNLIASGVRSGVLNYFKK